MSRGFGDRRRSRFVESGDIFGPDYRITYDSTVVRFDAPERSVAIADTDLVGSSYVLLPPAFLYNPETLRFHRPTPALQQTALPAVLADVPGEPVRQLSRDHGALTSI
jgi:hypothetical protein